MTNLGTAMPPGAQEAFRWHRRALTQDGAHVHALNNLGSQHLALNDVDAALAWFERAIAAGYPDGEARWNRGVARLVSGDLARGFADYEDRWGLRAFAGWRRPAEKPAWSPGPGNTRTVLVYAEQGIGDTLQFVRYLGQVAAMGWRVVLECQPSLVRLLECVPGASAVVANGKLPPAFDAQVPLLSLPALFGTTLDNIPSTPSYLTSEPAAWPELAAAKGRRVGLVWAGNPEHKNDANRSLDIDALRRLASGLMRRSDLALFSLQVGARRNDLAAIPGLDWTDLSPRLKDFADTAAAIAALDLVVAVDTSVIHLTGALGRAGSLLLPFSPDWRWLLGRSDSPWYPSLRLYRQVAAGNWSEPIDALLRDLDRHAS
jgi:tetratricopeptide (TPR) repeat protein